MFIQNMINRSVVVTQKRIEKAMLLMIAKYCHVLIFIYIIYELIPILFEVTYQ